MVMSDNSIVNLDNLALVVMEAGIRKAKNSTRGADRKRAYAQAVKSIAVQIKNNQALTPEQQESVLNLIYHDQTHKASMGNMRKILREIGSTLEYKQHEVLPNAKL
ncbi:hypothetical protein [Kosakonia phage 305]|uniref:DUF7367 domain-containing protein n=1 Tax=Kosakonia phage 305 TaxID=2863193 RepID=A0AAE7WFI6_9CAUD|nr:hypothetical protein PP421_gp008 [Kosakonia phage 305]QYN80159.1 hypothetical protein [Kosakonia phage 305]